MAKLKIKSHSKSLKNKSKKNIVFLPYKASMWDSLESIWKAAAADKEYCNTYVVPIPYADLTPDGKVAKWNCEVNLFPKNVPVLDYRQVDLKRLKPDMIFIHNPYDNYNLVTSVDSNYYSYNLKPLTKLLMYSPYYATSGAMSEGQKYMPSYDYIDYIIIQSDAMRPFFDPSVPSEKLVSLGSPKFDRVIQMCQNPPKIPEKWRSKMEGRKVYFYNTSLSGLLKDTDKFLKKMRYVFDTFEGRDDVCLLWRPHPLTNATLNSMRADFQAEYQKLKNYFIENNIGIYDDTPDIDKSIALSDVYIGDTGTSVTSLFGVAGKPMFFFNINFVTPPKEGDILNEILRIIYPTAKDYTITQQSRLYYAPNHDYKYQYYCDVTENSAALYSRIFNIDGKTYIFPTNTQTILVVGDHKIEREIPLQQMENIVKYPFFYEFIQKDDYVFMLPCNYPSLVRYNVKNEKFDYVPGINKIIAQQINGEYFIGGSALWNNYLLIASPVASSIIAIDINTLEVRQIKFPEEANNKSTPTGFMSIVPDGDNFWLLPYFGKTICRINIKEGTITKYTNLPKGFQCIKTTDGSICNERPFRSGVCDDKELLLVPYWGNMFVRLNKETGKMEEWETPFDASSTADNGYAPFMTRAAFVYTPDMDPIYFYYFPTRKEYTFDLKTRKFTEMDIQFDLEEVKKHAVGFDGLFKLLPYGCIESASHSLKKLLDNDLPGKPFNKDAQIKAYGRLNANFDGTCGENIYQFAKQKLKERTTPAKSDK